MQLDKLERLKEIRECLQTRLDAGTLDKNLIDQYKASQPDSAQNDPINVEDMAQWCNIQNYSARDIANYPHGGKYGTMPAPQKAKILIGEIETLITGYNKPFKNIHLLKDDAIPGLTKIMVESLRNADPQTVLDMFSKPPYLMPSIILTRAESIADSGMRYPVVCDIIDRFRDLNYPDIINPVSAYIKANGAVFTLKRGF